jgi:four helix bundle protein
MAPHRDLAAWQTARDVVAIVLRLSRGAWKPYLSAVFAQLQRSSLSVQLNIAEGYASGRTRRCRYFLEIAYASAMETDDLLQLLADEAILGPEEAAAAIATCRRSQALIRGLIRRYPAAAGSTRPKLATPLAPPT